MTRAVIFDMDGVLIDSEPLHLVAINRVLAPHGVQLSDAANTAFLGWTEDAFWRSIVSRFHLPGSPAEYSEARRREFFALMNDAQLIGPGVEAFLRGLKAMHLPLAVASSSDAAVITHVLNTGRIAHYFDAIAAGDDVRRSKPDPEIFLLAASRLGISPEQCLVFEDSPHGITAALAAGMRCVRVMTSTTRDVETPTVHLEIESFAGLDPAAVLERMNPRL